MRRAILLVASLLLAVLLFGAVPGSTPVAAQEGPAKPNFVFILADDMRKDDLRYMPKTNALLGDQGMQFENAFVSNALCCPSRATIFRGQYSHNTGVWTNHSPDGGWEAYRDEEQDNLATRLDNAGYRTGLFGKYINEYNGTTVPLGWDEWFARYNSQYYNYDVNHNGVIKHFGAEEGDYLTDVLRGQVEGFVSGSEAGEPFFAYVSPAAPHAPHTPAPRHEHAYDGETAPRLPSFDEEDVSDKPPWIEALPRRGEARAQKLDARHEKRVESLQAVDELVEGVVQRLKETGALQSTYIVFTSDNGWHHGEHRLLRGKGQPYEESIRVPLLIRAPGVQGSSTELVLNTDYLPTLTDLAGVPTPEYADGRSLRPLLEGRETLWRDAILLESRNSSNPERSYYAVRTRDMKYVEYEGGFRELYDLNADPYELANSYDASAPPADLAARLEALKGCAGATCRQAEDGP